MKAHLRTTIDAVLRRSPAQPLFRLRNSDRLAVLAYHAIEDGGRFEEHLGYLRRVAHPVSLSEVVDAARSRAMLPMHAVLVTFDDGDRSVLEVAAPLLERHGIPGVAFLISGLIDSGRPTWWAEVEALVRSGGRAPALTASGPDEAVRALKRMPEERRRATIEDLRSSARLEAPPAGQLRAEELATLEAAGVEIGSHTATHEILPGCTDESVEAEIADAHRALTESLGHAPRAFAYPNGDGDPRAENVLRRLGYEAAFLFDHRLARLPIEDPLSISRVRIDAAASVDRLATVVTGLHPAVHHVRGQR
ncbi:MAG TPA: polysaccharide deacetylase family protein [Actinomycetota bacterium]